MKSSFWSIVVLFVLICQLPAQTTQPGVGRFGKIPIPEEIRLARTAAPSWFSDSATVYVYTGSGFRVASAGTRGACAVLRDHPESMIPICFDDEAARTVMHAEFMKHVLFDHGVKSPAVDDSIASAFGHGRIPLPRRPALTFMMSSEQILYAGAEGNRVGRWQPHVMIYQPGATAKEYGISEAHSNGHFQVAYSGTTLAHIIITTREWATKPANE